MHRRICKSKFIGYMQMDKNCPPGKILNPKTGKCVKADGKIGMQLSKKVCPSDKILHP